MRYLSVRVEDKLLLDVKQRALSTGVSLSEVVTRLLQAYVAEKVHVRPREEES